MPEVPLALIDSLTMLPPHSFTFCGPIFHPTLQGPAAHGTDLGLAGLYGAYATCPP